MSDKGKNPSSNQLRNDIKQLGYERTLATVRYSSSWPGYAGNKNFYITHMGNNEYLHGYVSLVDKNFVKDKNDLELTGKIMTVQLNKDF